ncbi:DUF6176 family protein [Alloalcanivorax xenomutans]|uniref:DUF6176 family protein n=1 Tax=Alloalcanivorax xenomutans TaxID=1094342 RepID=UPI003D9ACF37
MEVSCLVIELKPDSLERVKEWADFITSNREEATSTLKNEGVTIEIFFHFSLADKDYLIGYMRAKSMTKAVSAVKHSLSEIDAYHQQFKKDTWVHGFDTNLMFDLSRIKNESDMA